MSKAAVNHLVRTMAIELAPHRINANVVNSDAADCITGTTLRVDGGFMVGLSLPEAAA